MSRRLVTMPWIPWIALLASLAIATACSKPSRESPELTPPEPAPTTSPSPESATPAPTAQPQNELAAPEARIPTPSETPNSTASGATIPPTDPKAPPTEPAPDPLKSMRDDEERRAEYAQSLPRLASARDAAADLVARRQKELLAFKNPFVARPQLAPDEADAIKGMDGSARVAWAEGRIADAKAALEAAQQAYDNAKANPPPD